MRKSTLHSLIIGFSPDQHIALLQELNSASGLLRLNEKALKPAAFDLLLKRSQLDVVFLKHSLKANFLPLYKKLSNNNQDCVVVELIDPSCEEIDDIGPKSAVIQRCQLLHDSSIQAFHLILQFVMQYVMLKKDFRRCKSLLYLSESRALRLVDSSNHAIAFMANGKFIHANIPFLVMFSADSMAELKRFSLSKLITQDEHEVFSKYLTHVNSSQKVTANLVLNMRRTSGATFNAKIQISQVVSNGQRCHQIWVERRTQPYKKEVIPVTKTLNIWDMPLESVESIEKNPFDRVLGTARSVDVGIENSLSVLQRELLSDNIVRLRFRELYNPSNPLLSAVWVKLDVDPDSFRMVNSLLSRTTARASRVHASFWDQLMFELVLESLASEVFSERSYFIVLSANTMHDSGFMVWLYRRLKALGNKTKRLTLVLDAEMPMNRIPQAQKITPLLAGVGCGIALNNFSVNTTPLFLFKHMKPDHVVLDTQWIDELKSKNDNGLFIKRFVKNLETLGTAVLISQSLQKHQDRLFVLTAAAIGQEIPTQSFV